MSVKDKDSLYWVVTKPGVKLPIFTLEGERTSKHPLVWAAQAKGLSQAGIARAFGISRAAVSLWFHCANRNRHFLVPANRALKLATLLSVPPFYLRPDIYPDTTWKEPQE